MFLKGDVVQTPEGILLVIKRNGVSTHTATWMKLEFLSEKSQLENSVDFGVPFTCNSKAVILQPRKASPSSQLFGRRNRRKMSLWILGGVL